MEHDNSCDCQGCQDGRERIEKLDAERKQWLISQGLTSTTESVPATPGGEGEA